MPVTVPLTVRYEDVKLHPQPTVDSRDSFPEGQYRTGRVFGLWQEKAPKAKSGAFLRCKALFLNTSFKIPYFKMRTNL